MQYTYMYVVSCTINTYVNLYVYVLDSTLDFSYRKRIKDRENLMNTI